eukprot:m.337071 g.337071  ORF g.337071 m.337071 type:complete len:460 (-) comp19801_c3_seq4:1749-3128(-)
MGFGKKKGNKRDANFTEEPEDGWLLEGNALVEENVFYSFQVQYVGNIEVTESLRSVSMEDQTKVVKELIQRMAEGAGVRLLKKKRKIPSHWQPFFNGSLDVGLIDVTLGISAEGMMIGAPQAGHADGKPVDVIYFHKMENVSFAAGGDDDCYSLIAYVAKNDSGDRLCHVFECDELGDEVLETLGQSFTLAKDLFDKRKALEAKRRERQREARKAKKQQPQAEAVYDMGATGYLETSPAVYDVGAAAAPTAEVLYDTGAAAAEAPVAEALYDTGAADEASTQEAIMATATPSAAPSAAAPAPAAPAAAAPAPNFGSDMAMYDTATQGAMATDPTAGMALYDTPDAVSEAVNEAIYDIADKSDLVKVLNRHTTVKRDMRKSTRNKTSPKKSMRKKDKKPSKEDVKLMEADMVERKRPSWVVVSPHDQQLGASTSLADLKKQFAAVASTAEEVIVEEEDDE